ncbi:hypothetical protein NPIL_171651 [Nephila pilipes]|uniref:Uncharacterized protein n=1 Tax=Nephila pilipes TaxID=299642 RepID=A0A8X6MXG7_NEPPI|nr:hypothetical protein NPIL_171651 [Nephila pilipes]
MFWNSSRSRGQHHPHTPSLVSGHVRDVTAKRFGAPRRDGSASFTTEQMLGESRTCSTNFSFLSPHLLDILSPRLSLSSNESVCAD